ncbi:MAG: 2Fe-2S iron-sulfur cluster-binding protein [Candidatus Nanopelagicales bacterium]
MSQVNFEFDAKILSGQKGEPLAAALLKNGIKTFTESTYLSRPRGVMALGAEEPCALVQIDSGAGEPMFPATQVELVAGLAARGLAGIGDLPNVNDDARYDKANRHVEVLIIGAGLAGLQAAKSALKKNQRVMLIDDAPTPGGFATQSNEVIDPELLAVLEAPNLVHLQRTTAVGLYDQGYVVAIERRTDHLAANYDPKIARIRTWHIRAKEIILATGAFQRYLVFPNNDRPGIMLSHSAATYIDKYQVNIFKNAVVVTVDDQGYVDALRLHKNGVKVHAIVDVRSKVSGNLVNDVKSLGIELFFNSTITNSGADQNGELSSVEISQVDLSGKNINKTKEISCDLLAVSGGWTPTVHIATFVGIKPKWIKEKAAFVLQDLPKGISAVGTVAGDFGKVTNPPAIFFGILPEDELAQVSFIDLQRDATVRDLKRATGAGLTSIEHIKRYTTIGTAHDQGKTSGTTTIGLLSQLINKEPQEIGTLTFRPPYIPVPFAALAGRDRGELSDPIRTTPIHQWHQEAGAPFEDVGQWKRPWYFPLADEDMDQAVARECLAARNQVAVMDASTLGKIDIQGPDAAEFLDRIYTNMFSTLKINHSRYGLMCGVDGMVFDDGVTTRLGENHFLMTTTTSGAAKVLDWLEEWLQTEWPELKVYCTSVTEHWSTVAIVGPKSRELMKKLSPGLDVSNDAFPFMTNQFANVAEVPARIARISFSGELAYEINVEAIYGLHIWNAVIELGKEFGITPYGTETMHVLRAEKGFVIVGQETDGTQTPQDLAMDWIVSKKKDFIGKRSFSRSDTARENRHQLVGVLPTDKQALVPEGSYLVAKDSSQAMVGSNHLGHVTSFYYSAELDRTFGLAILENGKNRIGEKLMIPIFDEKVEVEITEPIFYDKENLRRDG